MSNFKSVFAFAIPLSFVFGTWWGFQLVKSRQYEDHSELRILAYRDSVPKEIFTYLKEKRKIRAKVDWVDDPADWHRQFTKENGNYDLVFSYNFQTEVLISQGKLTSLNHLPIPNSSRTSVDFKRMPYDKEGSHSRPVSWGLMGFIYRKEKLSEDALSWNHLWKNQKDQRIALRQGLFEFLTSSWQERSSYKEKRKRGRRRKKTVPHVPAYVSTNPVLDVVAGQAWVTFATAFKFHRLTNKSEVGFFVPADKIPYWVLSVSIPQKSRNKSLSGDVLNELLSDHVARLFVLKGRSSSTNISIEDLQIEALLKPSYLRTLSLKKLFLLDAYWLF